MREILFKAKRTANGEWVEGSLVKIDEQDFRIVTEEDLEYSYTRYSVYDGEMTRVDKDTICQWTGLYDYKDNKIWENDIVKDMGCGYEGSVKYTGAEYSIEWKGNSYIRKDMTFWVENRELEVIGNIFDNSADKLGGANGHNS